MYGRSCPQSLSVQGTITYPIYLGFFLENLQVCPKRYGYMLIPSRKHFHSFVRTAQVKPSSLSASSRQGCLKSPDAEPKVLVLQMDQVLYS